MKCDCVNIFCFYFGDKSGKREKTNTHAKKLIIVFSPITPNEYSGLLKPVIEKFKYFVIIAAACAFIYFIKKTTGRNELRTDYVAIELCGDGRGCYTRFKCDLLFLDCICLVLLYK